MVGNTALLSYESDIGANIPGSAKGPETLIASPFMSGLISQFNTIEKFKKPSKHKKLEALPDIAELCTKLAIAAKSSDFFVTLGGDHTCAIGSFSGAAENHELGLIWIDAHFDAHTHISSESKNPHGMPLAALLGHGDSQLTQILSDKPKLKPENLCIVGARSFEDGELKLLKRLNVRIFYMDEINERGIDSVMNEAFEIIQKNTTVFGISLDLDGIDPEQAPGVSCPEPGGIDANELIKVFKNIPNADKLVGVEIVEFNPEFDIEGRTEKIAADCLKAVLESKGIVS